MSPSEHTKKPLSASAGIFFETSGHQKGVSMGVMSMNNSVPNSIL